MKNFTKSTISIAFGLICLTPSFAAENATPTLPAPSVETLAKAEEETPLSIKAARNLRAGSILRETDILFEGGTADEIAFAKESYYGKELKRTIYANRPIMINDTGLPTVVKRNDIISIEFAKGALIISTDGRALDPGAVGDTIRIMNLKSRVILSAVITGENKALTQ